MEHKKYSSIDRNLKTGNKEKSKYLEDLDSALRMQGLTDLKFVATEKVHGCNLAMYYDGNDYKVAKRTSFIDKDSSFMGNSWSPLLEQHKSFLKFIYNKFQCKGEDYITAYGELAGGGYNNKTEVGHKQIQSEIEYAPFNFFYVFDIAINGEKLPYDQFLKLCDVWTKENTLIYAKPLKYGTFDEISTLNPDGLKSNLPEWLGVDNNTESIMEGYVVKEVTGGKHFYSNSIVFKILSSDFDDAKGKSVAKPKDEAIVELEKLGLELGETVNELLVNKIHGNYGFEHDKKNISRYTSLLTEDILKNWLNEDAENRSYYEGLNNKHKKAIKKSISKKTSTFYFGFLNNL